MLTTYEKEMDEDAPEHGNMTQGEVGEVWLGGNWHQRETGKLMTGMGD